MSDSRVIAAYQLLAKVKIVLAMKIEIICMLHYIFIIVTRRMCCKENADLLPEKLVGIKCITYNEDFKLLCLNKTVLETACIHHRRYENKFTDI